MTCGINLKNKMGGDIMIVQKQKVDFEKSSVEESLFIPLLVKVKESERGDAVFTDTKAQEIINSISLDINRFDGGNITYHGILVRTAILDSIVNDFIAKNPEGIILNLGAGLDTRIYRMDCSKIYWFDIDLPRVIELRRRFFSESERVRFISKSLLDESWANDINIDISRPILIIAEGLLMYFTESELKMILNILTEKFSNAQMCFDVIHKFFVGKGISSKFKWGIEKASEIEQLSPKVKLVKAWSAGDYHKNRQELFFRAMNVFQSTRNRSQVLLVKLG